MQLSSSQKNLLDILINDEKKVNNKLYSASPYWKYKTKRSLRYLKKYGLTNFRGIDSGVGTSFADNIVLDTRKELGTKGKLISWITHLPIINKIFDEQIKMTSNYINNWIYKNKRYYESNDKVKQLVSKYKIENSVEFGCLSKFKLNNREYSTYYLQACDRLENISKLIDLNKIVSYFEIGGGFGANIHLLLNNFKNIKKIIYLDIVPNLFVGTEYLRRFYGNSVKDYSILKEQKKIKFSNNNELEIFCIPPWKIEDIIDNVDHFHNSASFQEMTENIIKNYKNFIFKLLKEKSISLTIYDGWKRNKTLNPDQINNIFENIFTVQKIPHIDNEEKNIFYLISK